MLESVSAPRGIPTGGDVRNMSFRLTERQLLVGEKTVTRRLGWKFLKPFARLKAVRQAMGLKRGERQRVLGWILVASVRRERLCDITVDEIDREGFPEMGVDEFVEMFCEVMRCEPNTEATRIEFHFVPKVKL